MTDDDHEGPTTDGGNGGTDGRGDPDGSTTPVGSVDGIGESESIALAQAGVATVEDLLAADPADLADRTGYPAETLGEWRAKAADAVGGAPGEDAGSGTAPDRQPGGATDAGAGGDHEPSRTRIYSGTDAEAPPTDPGDLENAPTAVDAGTDEDGAGDDAAASVEAEPTAVEDDGASAEDGPVPADRDPADDATAGPGDSNVRTAGEVTGGDGPGSQTDPTSRGGEVEAERTRPGRGEPERTEAELEEEILDPEERVGPGEAFCFSCGEIVDENAVICPECGVNQPTGESRSQQSSVEATRTSGEEVDAELAALASLFLPGAGALLSGQNSRAAGWFAAFLGVLFLDTMIFVISAILTAVVIGLFGFLLIPIVHLILHPLAAYDAYNQAQRINAGEVRVD